MLAMYVPIMFGVAILSEAIHFETVFYPVAVTSSAGSLPFS
jgi:hypothetical protein